MNIDMIDTLKRFTEESLFEASSYLLNKLNIGFEGETAEPIDVAAIYDATMPQYLTDALKSIKDTYFIGVANDLLLSGSASSDSLDDISETIQSGGKYDGMFVFACDTKKGEQLTRSQVSALTRAFNRISYANPVILVIREGDKLSLATCERMNYTQEWRQGTGEKLGKVSILRNVNCAHPHRGHVDILDSLSSKVCNSFDELYQHWMDVFSSELLTKKFYNELSDWYAWAVQVAKFPNDLASDKDDAKYNHEACIRLITRLIFVWFLKQKHLIPEEFFDEKYIRENLIENFDPHDKQSLYYDAGKSKYYRLILQNLFFAMLNCPIVAEGKTSPNNRRFRGDVQSGLSKSGYNVNNLMRYKSEFADKGAEKFVKLANANVPFLNGGLFDCLDDKPRGLYYDGFSERKESLEQLFFPDYLFFGEEVGAGIDLSQWYDDVRKKNVSARGVIDILKRYSFTIEENTPYDQEVSLDPELLGKVFENLLAAYNPETKLNARRQTGSFYTPREIVQYMVDESLVAHLKRMCGDEMEHQYRALLSYASDDPTLSEMQKKNIMHALYNCRVLDPACGSGAFPMGVLQQMVHVLKRIDPTNEMWNSMMVDIAIEDARKELQKVASGDDVERQKIEDNRKARLDDIENAFNTSINDPDYARKLYLIEHCIYGVDIQPIATQISKLRFFISLVVDQNKLGEAKSNFGIRPLPNLESKFVTANTLIPLDRARDLFSYRDEIVSYEEELQEINHRIFLAKKNTVKKALQERMYSVRLSMAQVMENIGAIGKNGYSQLVEWDMFDQNASASFFDPEWMFGVKEGFDIVIGNPPYIRRTSLSDKDKANYEKLYKSAKKQYDIYLLFIEKGLNSLKDKGYLCYINPIRFFNSDYGEGCRKFMMQESSIRSILDVSQLSVFENAMTYPCVLLLEKGKRADNMITYNRPDELSHVLSLKEENNIVFPQSAFNTKNHLFIIPVDAGAAGVIRKIDTASETVRDYFDVARGLANNKVNFNGNRYNAIKSKSVDRYRLSGEEVLIDTECATKFALEMVILPRTVLYLKAALKPESLVLLDRIYYLTPLCTRSIDNLFVLGIINSKLINYWFEYKYSSTKVSGGYFDLNGNQIKSIPLPKDDAYKLKISTLVKQVLESQGDKSIEQNIDYMVYKTYGLTYDEVKLVDPELQLSKEEYEQINFV